MFVEKLNRFMLEEVMPVLLDPTDVEVVGVAVNLFAVLLSQSDHRFSAGEIALYHEALTRLNIPTELNFEERTDT